ncbi:glycosyltransferase family 9 protein [Aliagarivorans marinus]|uniref:glycosyltransferase family 9 protein n=1 Tax=Aliagarivorans marinus TaxID=561965 RepID=UPI00047B9707|nr:glycosyltransferase family 9 protein [Aliagarivorans marinus]
MTRHLWVDEGVSVSKRAQAYLQDQFDPLAITKIAVIRHAALGDMIAARPFFVEARKFFPNAKITLCLDAKSKLGAPLDLVDEVFYIYGEQGTKKVSERFSNLRSLPEQDILFDLAATNRSHLLSIFAKAKLKMAFPRRDITRPVYDICLKRSVYKYETETLLDLLVTLGHFPPHRLDFALPEYQGNTNTIAFFTGASTPSKCYPLEQYKQVIGELAEHYPSLNFVLLEGMNPEEKRTGWEALLERENVSAQETMSIDALTEFMANKCDLLICNDTGVRNIALATHTPTLGLFYSTLPQRYWPKYEPHFVAYSPDRSVPSVESVIGEATKAIESLIGS